MTDTCLRNQPDSTNSKTVSSNDLNNNITEYTHHPQSKCPLPNEKSEACSQMSVTQTSFVGLFSSCSPAVPNAQSDVEVYRQSYLEPASNSRVCTKEGRPSTPLQKQCNNHTGSQHIQESTELGYSHNQNGRQQISGASNEQQCLGTADQNQQIHSIYQQFHGNTDQQFHNQTDPQRYQGTPTQAMPGSQNQQLFEPTKTNTLEYQMGANSSYLSPTGYRQGFADDQNIAAEQLASELVKTYGGQNSHM